MHTNEVRTWKMHEVKNIQASKGDKPFSFHFNVSVCLCIMRTCSLSYSLSGVVIYKVSKGFGFSLIAICNIVQRLKVTL